MTPPKPPMLPSERIKQLRADVAVAPNSSFVAGWIDAIIAYLDEQAAAHPVASYPLDKPLVACDGDSISWDPLHGSRVIKTSPPGEGEPDPPFSIPAEEYVSNLERQRDEAIAKLSASESLVMQWELFGAEISGCTNYSGEAALTDARAAMEGHIGVTQDAFDKLSASEARCNELEADRETWRQNPGLTPSELADAVKALKSSSHPAGGPAEMFWAELGDVALDCYAAAVSRADHAESHIADLEARCNRLTGELEDAQSLLVLSETKLAESERVVAELREQLTRWQARSDRFMAELAKRDAVVEAAQTMLAATSGDSRVQSYSSAGLLRERVKALSALDAGQVEPMREVRAWPLCLGCGRPANGRSHDCGEGGRPILVGSTWRRRSHPDTYRRVEEVGQTLWASRLDDPGHKSQWSQQEFRDAHEWLSDPPSESGEG